MTKILYCVQLGCCELYSLLQCSRWCSGWRHFINSGQGKFLGDILCKVFLASGGRHFLIYSCQSQFSMSAKFSGAIQLSNFLSLVKMTSLCTCQLVMSSAQVCWGHSGHVSKVHSLMFSLEEKCYFYQRSFHFETFGNIKINKVILGRTYSWVSLTSKSAFHGILITKHLDNLFKILS